VDPTVETPNVTQAAKPPAIQPTSPESAALRAYFTQVQSAQLTQGLLRRDGGGPDAPFTADMLVRNYLNIAFLNEYVDDDLAPGAAGTLRRWTAPVRIGLEFGPSVPPSQRRRDTADVRAFAARLSRVTGHPVTLGPKPNFIVAFLSEDDRSAALPAIAERLDGLGPRSLSRLNRLSRETYCAVVAFSEPDTPAAYAAAVAVIRAENPDLLRLSCIHEEIAQGMGLANDSRDARPSIFNDDDEFALLTTHDEHLLRMHYDTRLTPGMTAETSGPVVRRLATALLESGT
jgi:hypothetical protein